MIELTFPEWGSSEDRYHPWHLYTGPQGDMHAGYLLDTVVGVDPETGNPRVYEVLRCEPCISVHVTPLPSKESLKKYYTELFFQRDKPTMVENYERDRQWWEHCVHAPLLKQAANYNAGAGMPRLLDIGAGPGIALDVAQGWGWNTYAIEPSPGCAQRLTERGHLTHHGTLETFSHEHDGEYNIVYVYEVLEHQPEPEAFLLRCYELLAPGGILVVCVPNDYSPTQLDACKKLGLPRYWLTPPQHVFMWTPKMLQLQVRRCGFDILDIRGTYPIDQHLLQGEDYITYPELGRKVHERRMRDELFAWHEGRWSGREQQYRRNLAEKRLGREIICIARKQG